MMHDSDPFNRWQAAQTYATNLLTAAARDGAESGACQRQGGRAARQALAPPRAGRCAAAGLSRRIPQTSDRVRHRPRAWPRCRHRRRAPARETLRATIGTGDPRRPWPRSTSRSRPPAPIRPTPRARACARLRSAALDLLVGNRRGRRDRARRTPLPRSDQHDRRHRGALHPRPSSTGRRATRRSIISIRAGRTSLSCSTNGSRCRRGPRAPIRSRPSQALLSHPKFSLKNPNRIRALIGSFVHANPTGFNRADGAGYRLLADQALEIDRFNPHVAARLLGAFESWRTLEPGRQARAKAVLEVSRPNLCPPTATRSSPKPLGAPRSHALSTGY